MDANPAIPQRRLTSVLASRLLLLPVLPASSPTRSRAIASAATR